jgi:hypothetical protein
MSVLGTCRSWLYHLLIVHHRFMNIIIHELEKRLRMLAALWFVVQDKFN